MSPITIFADGAAYDPVGDAWRAIAPSPLEGRFDHAAVWTGQAMLLSGGFIKEGEGSFTPLTTGALHDPANDTWRPLPRLPFLAGSNVSAWTGEELIAWSGQPVALRP